MILCKVVKDQGHWKFKVMVRGKFITLVCVNKKNVLKGECKMVPSASLFNITLKPIASLLDMSKEKKIARSVGGQGHRQVKIRGHSILKWAVLSRRGI